MVTTSSSEASVKTNGEEVVNGQAKAVARSEATYPYHPVQEGLRVAEAVQKAGGNSATEQDLMKELGLTSTQSHAWSYRISTAREFGLIERTGRGAAARIQITDLYLSYACPGSDAEKQAALMQIVLKPTLYVTLLNRYKGAPRPDVTGVANVMWRYCGILESVKIDAAKAFLASIEFAGLITNGVVANVSSNGVARASAMQTSTEQASFVVTPLADPPQVATITPLQTNLDQETSRSNLQTLTVPADFVIYRCKIARGRILEIPLPREMTKADVDRLHAFLLTQIDDDMPTFGA